MAAKLPNLVWLRSFEASARHLSFTAAAKELDLTQAALSKQVRYLELSLGEALFIRHARRLELTPLGRAYYPEVRAALGKLQSATEDVFGARSQSFLSIKVIESFALSWLLPRLSEFESQYPDIDLRILSSNWASDGVDLGVDFEIYYGFGQWKDRKAHRLTQETITPVIRPEDKARYQTIDDLEGERLIHVIGYQEGWARWFAAAGAEPNCRMIQVDSSRVSYALTKEGLGISLGRRSLVSDELSAGTLIVPFELDLEIEEGFYLAHAQTQLSPIAAAFRDWVIAQGEL